MRYRAKLASQLASGNIKGRATDSRRPFSHRRLAYLLTADAFVPRSRFCFTRDQLGQPALLSRRGVLVDDVLLPGAVEELHGFRVSRLSVGTSCRADLFECGPQLASVSAIESCPGTGLAHTLGSRPDSGHGNLGLSGYEPDRLRLPGGENIGGQSRKIKQEMALTLHAGSV